MLLAHVTRHKLQIGCRDRKAVCNIVTFITSFSEICAGQSGWRLEIYFLCLVGNESIETAEVEGTLGRRLEAHGLIFLCSVLFLTG